MSTPADQINLQGIDPNLVQQFQGQQQALAGDTQDYDDLSKKLASSSGQEFPQQAPERNMGVMSVAPYLIGLAALGGKGLGIHATTMLSATNGMVKGLIQGSEQRYKDEKQKYDDAYQKWQDKWTQTQRIYNEMRLAYKGRIDADVKALESTFKMMGLGEKVTMDDFKKFIQTQQLADKFKNTNEKITHDRNIEEIQRQKEQQKTGQGLSDRAKAIDAELIRAGVTIPGSRSGAVYFSRLNAIADQYPDESPQQIVQDIKSGQIDMKVTQTEATQAARKEASTSGAILALNKPGGLYDQLDTAAKKVNFGDAKVVSNLRLAAQGKTVADPDIQYYVTKIHDARAELQLIFAKTGQATDAVRKAAEEALPIAASYEELQQAMRSSREAADAVNSGNEAFIQSLKSGKSVSDALAEMKQNAGAAQAQSFSTEQEAQAAAQAGRIKPGDRITVGGVSGTWQ
jgi:hypothetical protein